ncbi:MAG TPA: Gfo/Idh/MocA family oxidoreductase [Spirochaetia bacterium]|nr:Gfo/Idh/MocA family oxidoreductase [Spirochaetia bacterium]
MIKIGIIGAGNMGRLHASLAARGGAGKVVAVCDQDASRAIALAAEHGAAAFGSADELLGSGLDMAFVAVPNTQHAPLARKALERGLHVFVEKPFATSEADAEALLEAARQGGRRLFVGLNRRFAPVYAEARRLAAAPEFKARNINIIQNDGDMRNPPWATDIGLTGGFLYDTTVHFLDMAEFLMGPIAEISAVSSKAFYPIEDGFAILLKFSGGRFGVVSSCGYASWMSPFERVQVVGDHRTLVTEELDGLRWSPGLGTVIEAREYAKLPYEEKWGYAQMHAHMFAALASGKAALNDAEVGARTIRLIAACERSAASGGAAVAV